MGVDSGESDENIKLNSALMKSVILGCFFLIDLERSPWIFEEALCKAERQIVIAFHDGPLSPDTFEGRERCGGDEDLSDHLVDDSVRIGHAVVCSNGLNQGGEIGGRKIASESDVLVLPVIGLIGVEVFPRSLKFEKLHEKGLLEAHHFFV